MSTKLKTKAESGHTVDQQLFDAAGVIVQFLVAPGEIQDAICLIRGTMPPDIIVPLHSHPEPEVIYVLEGSLEVFRANQRNGNGWTTASAGEVVAIQGDVRHALRNTSSRPAITALVTKSDLYKFFREVAKPVDPNRRPARQRLMLCRNSLRPQPGMDFGWGRPRKMPPSVSNSSNP